MKKTQLPRPSYLFIRTSNFERGGDLQDEVRSSKFEVRGQNEEETVNPSYLFIRTSNFELLQ